MMLFCLITEANFFVVFIALLVAFFLLGLIIGNIISRQKKTSKDKNTGLTKENKDKPMQSDTLGQDNREYTDPKQDYGQNQQQSGDPGGCRYYRWW